MKRRFSCLTILFSMLLFGCLSCGKGGRNGYTITVYGFSIMKESLEKEIYPAFAAKWKSERGEDIHFVSSFAGSEIITNQILQGAPADVTILSNERDIERLIAAGHASIDWNSAPHKGILSKSPFVILTREGNPKNIKDFSDLTTPGIRLVHPDPKSSGGGQWSILAIYGAEIKRAQREVADLDETVINMQATRTLQAIWNNVISTPDSAREARSQFENGYGDALITYEIEGLQMKQMGQPIEIVVPPATIFSEHPVAIVDRNVTANERQVIEAFRDYLWSAEAQKAFVKNNIRSIADESANEVNPQFVNVEDSFTIQLFGGWSRAFSEIIEKVFKKQVQRK